MNEAAKIVFAPVAISLILVLAHKLEKHSPWRKR
jgi:hypothetical protein